jgi:hypothetical protein
MDDRPGHDEQPSSDVAPAEHEASLLRTLPGLARIAAAAYLRSARWTARTSAEAGSRVIHAAVDGQDPAELFRSTGAEIRERTRRVLGIPERGEEERAAMTPEVAETQREEARRTLRERGEELLRRSRDVNFDDEGHPAYIRILDDLSPDEARILRLLVDEGPQPSIDVRSGLLPLQSTSELVAAGLNMIGQEAGCRHLDDVPAYLNNLHRLGLVWFSRETLGDTRRYQVLEAQPEVDDALKSASHTRTVRRSIHLTPFGQDFCELCLPADPLAAQTGEPDTREDGDRPG